MSVGLKRGTVHLEDHQAEWEDVAAKTIGTLRAILGDVAVDIQHVGSTSIKWICAKPIIDIAIAVNKLNDIEQYIDVLDLHGVVFRRTFEPAHMFFVMGDFQNEIRTHHIHVVEYSSDLWRDYILFRDYLNTFPEKAKSYESLKLYLAKTYEDNRKEYTAGKEELIETLLNEAKAWRSRKKSEGKV